MARTRAQSKPVVGIDLGGTNMQIGVVDGGDRIIGRDRRKTNARAGRDHVLERIAGGVNAACEDAGVAINDVAAVGIAAPGAIDIPRGVVLEAPNLRWNNVPLRDMLEQMLRCRVVVDNDVNGAIWGEYNLGALAVRREKPRDVLGVWLGTGVGGGLVVNRHLFHGSMFTAGEIGQTVIIHDGPRGRRTVEDFCSRTGMSRSIMQRINDHPTSRLRACVERSSAVIDSADLAMAYRHRDKLARLVVHEAAELLGIAIANWVTVLSLDTVVIGGGVTETLGEALIKHVHASFGKHVFPKRLQRCRLMMTRLKDDAGLLGAALLARDAAER